MADSAKDTRSGRAFYGDKTLSYAKRLSRESVEKHTDTSVLFFEVDWERSKKNFYGELLIKKFVNPKGIEVKGIVDLTEGGDIVTQDIPNQLLNLKFSCYVNHLQELSIDPKIGDYFATKNRVYFIYGKQITDANKNSVGVDRETVSIVYSCVEADSEQIFPGLYDSQDGGTKNDILGNNQLGSGSAIHDGQQ